VALGCTVMILYCTVSRAGNCGMGAAKGASLVGRGYGAFGYAASRAEETAAVDARSGKLVGRALEKGRRRRRWSSMMAER
jgi:hypothetical protein